MIFPPIMLEAAISATFLASVGDQYLEMDVEVEDCVDEGLPSYFLSVVFEDNQTLSEASC